MFSIYFAETRAKFNNVQLYIYCVFIRKSILFDLRFISQHILVLMLEDLIQFPGYLIEVQDV